MSNAVEPASTTDLAIREQEAAQLTRDSFQDERIAVPMVVVVQGTSKNPPEGSSPGDFVNTVTEEVYGSRVEFLVANFSRGRFYAERDEKNKRTGRVFVAGDSPVVPGNWPEEYRDRAFSSLDDAEERFRERVDAQEVPWGSGPPIATTYNYVGLIVGHEIPVRLSLQRTSTPAHRTITTLVKAQPAPWSRSIRLETERKVGGEGPYFVVNAAGYGDPPDDEFKSKVVELALVAKQLGFRPVGEDAETDAAPPKPEGADDDTGAAKF